MAFLVIISALILGSLVDCRSPPYPYRTGLIIPELLPPHGFIPPYGHPGHPSYGQLRPQPGLVVLPPGHPSYGPPGPPQDYQNLLLIDEVPAPVPAPGMTCMQNCFATEEWAPVCVTIGGVEETFSNRGTAACAERCRGQPMTAATNGACERDGWMMVDRSNLGPGMID